MRSSIGPLRRTSHVPCNAADVPRCAAAFDCLAAPHRCHILLQGAKGKAAIAEELLPVEVKLVASSFGTMLLRR